MEITVIEGNMLQWGFDSEPTLGVPNGYWGQGNTYLRAERVDPFPCYAHNVKLVERLADMVNRLFPLDGELTIMNAHYESTGRTNGWMTEGIDYRKDNSDLFIASIFLSGKRIPPHPAMTRYLVAHEYGHVVQYWLEKRFGAKDLIANYKKMRGIGEPLYYGGRTWHATAGEIFANDFRILGCDVETEFWPHEGFSVPEETQGAVAFWQLAKEGKWQEALVSLNVAETAT